MFHGITRALRNTAYRRYASGSSISLVGFWLQKVGVAWVAWELTHSGAWLGIVALADALPAVFLSPLGGVIADRFERIRLIRMTQFAQTLQAATLATFSYSGWLTIEILLVLVLILGTIQSFAQPVRLSLVPSLVRPEELSSAVALNSSLFNLARFVGPALAGILITQYGVALSFATAAGCFCFFLWMMFRVTPLRNEVSPRTDRPHMLSEVTVGLRYAVGHAAIGPIMLVIVAATVFGRSFVELLPAFSDRIFNRGAEGLALLVASMGVGALASSLWLAGRGHASGLTRIAVGFLLVVALGQAAFASTLRIELGVACMLVVGFATVATSISCQTLVQSSVEGHMRGRVMSIYGLVFRSGPAIGALILGFLAERFGLRWTVTGSAICCAAAWLWASTQIDRLSAIMEAPMTSSSSAEAQAEP